MGALILICKSNVDDSPAVHPEYASGADTHAHQGAFSDADGSAVIAGAYEHTDEGPCRRPHGVADSDTCQQPHGGAVTLAVC